MKIHINPIESRFNGIWGNCENITAAMRPDIKYDLTEQYGINDLKSAYKFLNSNDNNYAYSFAFIKIKLRYFKIWADPNEVVGKMSRWSIDNSITITRDYYNPSLDISDLTDRTVQSAVKLLNNSLHWPYEEAYVYSKSGIWHKLFRKKILAQTTTFVLFDFDLTLTTNHIYNKWSRSRMSVSNFLESINPVDFIVTKTEKDPIGALRKVFKLLLSNEIKVFVVTYGYKNLVVKFFDKLGLSDYVNSSNVLGWKEGFRQFNEPELHKSLNASLLSTYGKNTFIFEIIKISNLSLENCYIYLVDDTFKNINALKSIKGAKGLVGITDYTNRRAGTKYYINKLLEKLMYDKKISLNVVS